LGIFYAAFAVFLRKEPLFRFNRFYLLSALFLSYVIPILSFFPEFFSATLNPQENNSVKVSAF